MGEAWRAGVGIHGGGVADAEKRGGAVRVQREQGKREVAGGKLRPVGCVRGVGWRLWGCVGRSVGSMPFKRAWCLGGVAPVRGQEPGTLAGDAYWLGRAEIGRTFAGVRPIIFYDIGWAGARGEFGKSLRPMSGAGIGASVLDGLFRFDVAHGINPNHALRADLYTSARF